jgi:hypothetical protein
MKEIFYSNWNSVLLSIVGWVIILAVSYSKFGFSRYLQIGLIGAVAYTLWLVWKRYTTYIAIENNRWMINAEQRLFPRIKLDIASLLYIARAPHFSFRSWGGRMVMYFRDDQGKVRATYIPETVYKQNTLKAILQKLVSIKHNVELDTEYRAFVDKYDPDAAVQLKDTAPRRSMKEIEAYVAARYGPA